jgi:hypothetical protein
MWMFLLLVVFANEFATLVLRRYPRRKGLHIKNWFAATMRKTKIKNTLVLTDTCIRNLIDVSQLHRNSLKDTNYSYLHQISLCNELHALQIALTLPVPLELELNKKRSYYRCWSEFHNSAWKTCDTTVNDERVTLTMRVEGRIYILKPRPNNGYINYRQIRSHATLKSCFEPPI